MSEKPYGCIKHREIMPCNCYPKRVKKLEARLALLEKVREAACELLGAGCLDYVEDSRIDDLRAALKAAGEGVCEK